MKRTRADIFIIEYCGFEIKLYRDVQCSVILVKATTRRRVNGRGLTWHTIDGRPGWRVINPNEPFSSLRFARPTPFLRYFSDQHFYTFFSNIGVNTNAPLWFELVRRAPLVQHSFASAYASMKSTNWRRCEVWGEGNLMLNKQESCSCDRGWWVLRRVEPRRTAPPSDARGAMKYKI